MVQRGHYSLVLTNSLLLLPYGSQEAILLVSSQADCLVCWLMKINFLRGFLLSATQHGNKPPSRHEAESLKRHRHYTAHDTD